MNRFANTPGPIAATGMDAAEIVDGEIARLWVLLDPAPVRIGRCQGSSLGRKSLIRPLRF